MSEEAKQSPAKPAPSGPPCESPPAEAITMYKGKDIKTLGHEELIEALEDSFAELNAVKKRKCPFCTTKTINQIRAGHGLGPVPA